MLKDITLGQYFPGDTIVHRLDARTKLILVVLYIVALFQSNGWVSYIAVVLATAACMALSQIKPATIFKGLKPMLFIIVLTAALNIFYTQGTPIIPGWIITWEGIARSVKMILRIVLLITGTFLLTYTTSPIALTDGLELLLNPLKKIKVPVHEMTMMMSMALRFIPTLIEETDKIMSAQKARGADFETGSLIRREAAVRVGVPPGGRVGRRNGEPLLPRRRGAHEHEAAQDAPARLGGAHNRRCVPRGDDNYEEVWDLSL